MTGPRAEPVEDLRPFPPRASRLLVPAASRAAALAGLALYPACRPRSAIAQRAARALVRIAGPRALPSGRAWSPPLVAAEWDAVRDEWRSALGSFDAVAVHRRSAGDENGFGILLLDDGAPRAFVKLRRNPVPVAAERIALERLAGRPRRGFETPEVRGTGAVGTWHWLALEPLPPRVHRAPGDPDLESIADEIGATLESLRRPPETPHAWRPMHGDLTPWNLRCVGGRLWLLDWESVGWGPPGADPVYYRATAAALAGRRGRSFDDPRHADAVAFWRARIREWAASRRDRRMAAAVDRALASMGSPSA